MPGNGRKASGLATGVSGFYGRKRLRRKIEGRRPIFRIEPEILISIPEMLTSSELKSLNRQFLSQSTEEILRWVWDRFGTRAAIGTSFQGAGLVMIDLAQKSNLSFPVFTLDTGLLFPETLKLKQ